MSAISEARAPAKGRSLRPVPMLIFGSRWLQLPLYVGLIIAQGVYVVLFLKELWHLFAPAGHTWQAAGMALAAAASAAITLWTIGGMLRSTVARFEIALNVSRNWAKSVPASSSSRLRIRRSPIASPVWISAGVRRALRLASHIAP